MSDTLESLGKKKALEGELKSVVRTMKAMAASNISQYEMAVTSLQDYFLAISLGMHVYFSKESKPFTYMVPAINQENLNIVAIVFGSDQGLVGKFNDVMADETALVLRGLKGKQEIWAIGERINMRIEAHELNIAKSFDIPNSVTGIKALVEEILIEVKNKQDKGNTGSFYIFHNSPNPQTMYEPVYQRLLPLDEQWMSKASLEKWPTKQIPEIIGDNKSALSALIREYLFVSLFKSCAESLATENASRLAAMQRAEKNINEMLDELDQNYQRLRQNSIDQELFDVVAGFNSLK